METFHLYFITLLSWLPVHLFQWWDGHGPAKNHSELSRISSAQEYWIEAPPGVKSSMKCKNYLPNICKPQCILSFCPLSSWASPGDCRGQSPSRSCCRSLSPDTSSPYHQQSPTAPGDITPAPEGNQHCHCHCHFHCHCQCQCHFIVSPWRIEATRSWSQSVRLSSSSQEQRSVSLMWAWWFPHPPASVIYRKMQFYFGADLWRNQNAALQMLNNLLVGKENLFVTVTLTTWFHVLLSYHVIVS